MLPDIQGYTLEKGRKILLDSGYSDIKILTTASPKSPYDSYQCQRIIRVKRVDNCTVELLVCNI